MFAKLNLWIISKIKSILFLYEFSWHGSENSQNFKILHNLKSLLKFPISNINNDTVRLEADSMCQLRCPTCPTGRRLTKAGTIGWGYLKFSDFKHFVGKNPSIKNIELSNWGEIFLNPELKDIIEYAFHRDIALSVGNGVNLNTISEEMIQCLVKYKIRLLSVSIDGATNETYKIFRQGGDFNRVIENIKRINFYKKKFDSKYPELIWQFIMFGHNEHELPLAKKMARELNMDFRTKLNYNPTYSPVKNKELIRDFSGIGVASREEYKQKYETSYKIPCAQLWIAPQINWDGKLLGCCINKTVDFGNVFEKGLKECLRSEKYVYVKKMLLGKAKPRKDTPCYNCRYYENPERMKDGIQSPAKIEIISS